LRQVTEEGAWESWIEYFLNGAARMAEDVLDRAGRIHLLLDRWRRAVADSSTAAELVGLLGENPFWTITGAAGRLGVAYTTARRAVERLAEASILTALTDARRGRVFCARDILEILDEPARLRPGAQ
jgi:Fic family protein